MTEPQASQHTTSLLVMLTSLAVGLLAGVSLAWVVVAGLAQDAMDAERSLHPRVVEVVREADPDELQVMCLPYMRQTATTLEQARSRASALEVRIREKEAEIKRLEVQRDRESSSSQETQQRLEEARAQLGTLEAELSQALDENTELLADLARAREQLADTRMELAVTEAQVIEAREATLDQQWRVFVSQAQLRICEDGSADRLARCRGQIVTALETHRRRFKQCVRSGQATPEVRLATRADDVPRGYADWLDRSSQDLREWYILFCDPALPERPDGLD